MKQNWITNAFWIVLLVAIFLGLSACTGKTTSPGVPTTPLSTATSETLIPAGWATHTSQQCEYTISYPSEMLAHAENPYSETLAFNLENPDEGARNFIYVSVITPEIQNVVKQGVYLNDVYNYDPVETEILLNMQVGESKPVREIANTASSFTYQRQPDTTISGHAAQM